MVQDSDTPGIYHITYSATDTAGNKPNRSFVPWSIRMHRNHFTRRCQHHPEQVRNMYAGARWNDSVDGNGTADANGDGLSTTEPI